MLSDARELASDLSARTGYIIPATPDLIDSTGFYPIREPRRSARARGLRRRSTRRCIAPDWVGWSSCWVMSTLRHCLRATS